MSVGIDIDITFQNKAEKLKKSVIVKAIREASAKTALDTEKELKKTSPVLTGNLRRSFSGQTKGVNGFIVTGAYYWVYVNFGTSKMDANPFVTEAASGILADYKKNLLESLKSEGL